MAERSNRELWQRIASGLALAAIVVADAVAGGWSFSILVAVVAALMALEWGRLAARRHGRADLVASLAVPTTLAAVAGILLGKLVAGWLGLAAVATAAILLAGLARLRGWPAGWFGFGVLYVGIAPTMLVWLRNATEDGLVFVLFLFAAVWAADTAAFFAGRAIGGPKLAPQWSPNKTWAGFAGGIVAAAVVGVVMAEAFALPFLAGSALLGAALGAVAQFGDLFESWIKRRAGAKHSGRLIPGHGGVLDRLDGLIFATPVFALFAMLHP
ncbi:MAG: phosphatidate cytidylyltransferase [Alphaproteobacteria bacterium]